MTYRTRLLKVFALSPIASAIPIAFFIPPALLFTPIFGYPLEFVLGIPAYFLLAHNNYNELRHYVAASTTIGLSPVIYFIIRAHGFAHATSQDAASLLIVAGACALPGAVGGLAFWVILRPDLYRRPLHPLSTDAETSTDRSGDSLSLH